MIDFITTGKTLFRILKQRRPKKAVRYIYERTLSRLYQVFPHYGVKVVEEEWDYLIILDACRYDTFKELNSLPGRLEKRISLGSSTEEWLEKNFQEYYEDIVYVSANPQIARDIINGLKDADHFFKVEHVWDYGWNQELNTVPPSEVTNVALRMREKYPDKRMIIHYMQPHAPWIGETRFSGRELNMSYPTVIDRINDLGLWKIMGRAEDMGISFDLIRRAYRDNLRLVLDDVENLVNKLDGKIVVSTDHGECFGRKLLIEHPTGVYVRELVEIPWLVIEKPRKLRVSERRRVKRAIRRLRAERKI